jgi:hypothetical protein
MIHNHVPSLRIVPSLIGGAQFECSCGWGAHVPYAIPPEVLKSYGTHLVGYAWPSEDDIEPDRDDDDIPF